MNSTGANQTSAFDPTFFIDGIKAILAINVVVGLPANVYVLRLIAAGGAVASEVFALNLAVSEILFCCSSFYLLFHFSLQMSLGIGVLLLQLFLQLMLISRPLFQTCICLERFLAVVHPTMFLRFRPLRYRLLCCAVDWLLILLDCMTPLLVYRTILALLLICKSLLFFFILLYCGMRVLYVLKRPGPGDGGHGAESWNSMKKKAFKVIMITLVFNSSTQLLQLSLLGPVILYASITLILQITLVSLCISIVSSFITPLLYLHRAGKLPCINF